METRFDESTSRLFRFLLAAAPPNASAALLPTLVSAAASYDASRHPHGEIDKDGHLSPKQRKAQLRALLLNETSIAAQLSRRAPRPRPRPAAATCQRQDPADARPRSRSWRRVTGYDASFADHCVRYGFEYHLETSALLRMTSLTTRAVGGAP